jgi:putrescine transport system permease protein
MLVFSMLSLGLTPEVNALAVAILLLAFIAAGGAMLAMRRRTDM